MRKKIFLLILVLLTIFNPGCYTLLGTVAGPFTGPYDWDKHLSSYGHNIAPKILFFMYAPFVVLGPITGFYRGLFCDAELIRSFFEDDDLKLPNTKLRVFNIWRPFTSTYNFYDKATPIR